MAPLRISTIRHGGELSGFNIFSTNGAVPRGFFGALGGSPAMVKGRADHARMLAHAAKRRLAAQETLADRAYWKACAPVAVNMAIEIRCDAGLAPLP